jgi:hypothetical protein
VVVVSHAPALIDALQQLPECHSITLEKTFGQTTLAWYLGCRYRCGRSMGLRTRSVWTPEKRSRLMLR